MSVNEILTWKIHNNMLLVARLDCVRSPVRTRAYILFMSLGVELLKMTKIIKLLS